jgi:hypothetical protein
LQERTRFTRLDSLTDTYLVLQDSVLQSWNRVVQVESEKSRTLAAMIEEVAKAGLEAPVVQSLHSQLNQLENIRYSPATLSNPHVVSEYDEACETLFRSIFQLAHPQTESANAGGFQSESDWISKMKELTLRQRSYYDSLALRFNEFVEINHSELKEMERPSALERKPLFRSDRALR